MEELEKGLSKLTGLDFERALSEERLLGHLHAVPSLAPEFQIRLAALALGKNVHDLKALPIREYNRLCNTVSSFLNKSEDATP